MNKTNPDYRNHLDFSTDEPAPAVAGLVKALLFLTGAGVLGLAARGAWALWNGC